MLPAAGERRRQSSCDGKRADGAKEILHTDRFIADAVEIAARARLLYPYARGQIEEPARQVDLAAVRQAFQACHLDAIGDVGAWNQLTDRYL
jgi:hypothetical protein